MTLEKIRDDLMWRLEQEGEYQSSEEDKQIFDESLGAAYGLGRIDGMEETRERMIEEIWDMLIMSLPNDAENVSTARQIPDQAHRLLNSFLDKLNNENIK